MNLSKNIDYVDIENRNILYYHLNDFTKFKKTYKKNKDLINNIDNNGNTILIHSIIDSKDEITEFVAKNIDKKLIDHLNLQGHSAIFYCVMMNKFSLFKLLVDYGSDINHYIRTSYIKNKKKIKTTLLLHSIKMKKKKFFDYLINKKELNFFKMNSQKKNCIFTCMFNANEENYYLKQLLLKKPELLSVNGFMNKKLGYIQILFFHFDKIIINNVLNIFSKYDKHIDYDYQDARGYTMIHYLYHKKNDIISVKYIKYFLNGMKHPNSQDYILRNSSLHIICELGIWEQCEDILKNMELNIFLKNADGKTPLDFIKKDDVEDFMEMVKKSYRNNLYSKKFFKNDWENVCSDGIKKDIKKVIKKAKSLKIDLKTNDLKKVCDAIVDKNIEKNIKSCTSNMYHIKIPDRNVYNKFFKLRDDEYLKMGMKMLSSKYKINVFYSFVYDNINDKLITTHNFKNFLNKCTNRYVIIPLFDIILNLLIIDKNKKKVIKFNPLGYDIFSQSILNFDLKEYFKKINYTFEDIYEKKNNIGVFYVTYYENDKKTIFSNVLYFLLFIDLFLMNPNIKPSELFDKAVLQIYNKGYSFTDYFK